MIRQGGCEMRKYFIAVVSSAVALGLVTSVPAAAQQKTEKQCREEWKAAGGRKATGKTEKAYVAGCHVSATLQPAAPAAPAKPATPAKPSTAQPAAPAPAAAPPPAAAAPAKPATT